MMVKRLTHNGEPVTHYVNLDSPHTIVSNRLVAMRALKELGVIEWVMASGDVRAFWYDSAGKQRQKTYHVQDVKFYHEFGGKK